MKIKIMPEDQLKKTCEKLEVSSNKEDLKNCIINYRILDSYSKNKDEKKERAFKILNLYKKLITQTNEKTTKLEYFKFGLLEIVNILKCLKTDSENNLLKNEKTKLKLEISELFKLIKNYDKEGYSLIFSNDFKKIFNSKFTNFYLLKYLSENKSNKLGKSYHKILEKENLFKKFTDLVTSVFNIKNDNILSNSLIKEIGLIPKLIFSTNEFNQEINDNEYFKKTEEILKSVKKGKNTFLKYLFEEFEIKINDCEVIHLTEGELNLYSNHIFRFFFDSIFTDKFEKEISGFIKKIINDNKFLVN